MSTGNPGIPLASQRGPVTKPDFQSLEQAAVWYATLYADDVSESERQAWQQWLAQSPVHAAAWKHIEAVSRRFEPLREGGHEAAVAGITIARRGKSSRRQALASMVGFTTLGFAAWMGWRQTSLPETLLAWTADYRTARGEQREITLADGTHVWLNTDSALNVDYQPHARNLKLIAGEVLIQTAPDLAGRPFYVDTCFGRMRALGTRFSVRQDETHTRLDVFESAVEIKNTAGAVQRIAAGQSASFSADFISPVASASRAREAWRRGIILAENISLRELVAELARYRVGHIGVAPEVAELTVTGVYPATDPGRALSMLESTLPVRVRHTLPWWITVEAQN